MEGESGAGREEIPWGNRVQRESEGVGRGGPLEQDVKGCEETEDGGVFEVEGKGRGGLVSTWRRMVAPASWEQRRGVGHEKRKGGADSSRLKLACPARRRPGRAEGQAAGGSSAHNWRR